MITQSQNLLCNREEAVHPTLPFWGAVLSCCRTATDLLSGPYGWPFPEGRVSGVGVASLWHPSSNPQATPASPPRLCDGCPFLLRPSPALPGGGTTFAGRKALVFHFGDYKQTLYWSSIPYLKYLGPYMSDFGVFSDFGIFG